MEPGTIQHFFAEPRQCIYWLHPERVRGGMIERFELLKRYTEDTHLWRYLLRCQECGQLYFFEFYESIDWESGNDPQYSRYVPVSTLEEAAILAALARSDLQGVSPILCVDFPRDAETPNVYWRGRDTNPS